MELVRWDTMNTVGRPSISLRALRRAASALDSLRTCARWGDAGQRLANVDMLCALALQYEEACRIRHESCTHAGCIAWLMADEARGQAPSAAGNAVQVRTYHAAKGLEWPVVVLASLDWRPRGNEAFGLRMMPDPSGVFLPN